MEGRKGAGISGILPLRNAGDNSEHEAVKTLHMYLTRQMLTALGLTAFVFTFVLVLANGLKEALQLLINHQITVGVALEAVGLIVPWVLAFSLPVGMLTAALLVFGRFSADQELTATRASGISLLSLITPALLLSVAVSAICAWLNFDVAPASRMAYKELLYRAGKEHPTIALEDNQPMAVGSYGISAAKVGSDGKSMQDVVVTEDDTNGEIKTWAHGVTGDLVVDETNKQIVVSLHQAVSDYRGDDGVWTPGLSGDAQFSIPFGAADESALQTPLSDMTLAQLLNRKRQVERELAAAPMSSRMTKAQLRQAQRELRENVGNRTITPVLVYLNREVAFSFACIGFTMVGIPLGVRGHRRETSVGIAVALGLMLLYYSFIVLGQAWITHPERGPQFIMWLPNFVFEAAGAVMLWRANRGGS